MSLKTDIEMVKDELSSEEKFFEKAVVTEKFVKKYKKLMIGSVVAIVLFVAGDMIYTANKQSKIDSANSALAQLQKDPKNKAALASLETLSPALADVWLYSQAVATRDSATFEKLQKSKAMFVADLSTYELAQEKSDPKMLESYAAKKDAIYADLATVELALLLIEQNKIDLAHKKLEMITLNSPLSQVAKALMHYGVK